MASKKRIAIFSITYNPFIGGAEVAIKEVTDRLPDFEFDLLTARIDSKLPDQEKIGNVNVYRIGTGNKFFDKLFYPWRASRVALKMHKKNPYLIVHAVIATYAGLASLLFKKKAQDIPYILTLQSGDSDWFIMARTWFWYPLYKQIYTKADKITAISNWLADRAKRYGYKKEVYVISNGVDIEQFTCSIDEDEKSKIRESWGARENDFVVITASRLVYKNGIDTLIDSIGHLPDDVKLVIAGDGRDEKELKSKARKFGDKILFVGQVDHEKLPRLLKSADVFARISRTEGFGNSFIEAMASCLPVIATPVGGIVDFIKDKETGLFAKSGDAKSVAGAIMLLKNDSELREKISKAGQSLAREKYDWKIITEQYKNIYNKI